MTLPEYQTEYPSRFKRGTLGWVLDQEAGAEEVTRKRKEAIADRRPPRFSPEWYRLRMQELGMNSNKEN